ncbi:hypothetical protein LEMLEM_LOCUS24685 [Lemmus lemmus]
MRTAALWRPGLHLLLQDVKTVAHSKPHLKSGTMVIAMPAFSGLLGGPSGMIHKVKN